MFLILTVVESVLFATSIFFEEKRTVLLPVTEKELSSHLLDFGWDVTVSSDSVIFPGGARKLPV